MFKIKKKSGWTWVTSAGGAAGYGPVVAGSGSFTLKSPGGGEVEFKYKSAGASFGIGGKVNLSGSTPDTYSTGQIYLVDTFSGAELAPKDIEGFCLVQDVSVGAGLGGSVTAMLLGIPTTSVPAEIVKNTGALGVGLQLAVDHPNVTKALLGPLGGYIFGKVSNRIDKTLRTSANALLIMGGFNAGPQLSAGISGSLGYVYSAAGAQNSVPNLVMPSSPEAVSMRSALSAQDDSCIRLSGDMLFDFDRSSIKPQAEAMLLKVAAHIRQKSPRHICVEGHTDSIGTAVYNMELSKRRAHSVAKWLAAHNVVKLSDVMTNGWGKSRPAAPNRRADGSDDKDGRAKNRRVEIWLMT